jgi:hypothetical protein
MNPSGVWNGCKVNPRVIRMFALYTKSLPSRKLLRVASGSLLRKDANMVAYFTGK